MLRLCNALLMDSASRADITVEGNRITAVENAATGAVAGPGTGVALDLEDSLLFPGLVNSHDHLDFNLFPQLGHDTYRNYTEWGNHLQKTFRPEISAVLRVPLLLREQWGVIKNLLAGVTMVVNHGLPLKLKEPAIAVHERYHCLHSVAFEKHWRRKLNNPFLKKFPYVIHVGEGTDRAAYREINRLLRWNWLRKPLIGVHAVAMDRQQAKAFDAIVWCPGSNFFMLNKTAAIDRLQETATILFGTDSTLTASWNIWDHIRLARKTGLLGDGELYGTLIENPARTWHTGTARVEAGSPANLVAARVPRGINRMDAFFGTGPESIRLVIAEGKIRLYDEDLHQALSPLALTGFSRIRIGTTVKYVKGDLISLVHEITAYLPGTQFPFQID